MKPAPLPLFEDWEFRENLDLLISGAVCQALERKLPVTVNEASWICRFHAVNHRFDFFKGGQDICMSRLNLYTNGYWKVVRAQLG
jgi:hypothetical protein